MTPESKFSVCQRGRSWFGASIGLFACLLVAGCWFTGSFLARVFSLFPLCIFVAALNAFIRRESWSFEASAEEIVWDHARWPRSKGRVPIASVEKIIIDEASTRLVLHLKNGKLITVEHLGRAARLHRYFQETLRDVKLEFIEDPGH
jgi:carotenoid cleavage dioxygenase-like enzyme